MTYKSGPFRLYYCGTIESGTEARRGVDCQVWELEKWKQLVELYRQGVSAIKVGNAVAGSEYFSVARELYEELTYRPATMAMSFSAPDSVKGGSDGEAE